MHMAKDWNCCMMSPRFFRNGCDIQKGGAEELLGGVTPLSELWLLISVVLSSSSAVVCLEPGLWQQTPNRTRRRRRSSGIAAAERRFVESLL